MDYLEWFTQRLHLRTWRVTGHTPGEGNGGGCYGTRPMTEEEEEDEGEERRRR